MGGRRPQEKGDGPGGNMKVAVPLEQKKMHGSGIILWVAASGKTGSTTKRATYLVYKFAVAASCETKYTTEERWTSGTAEDQAGPKEDWVTPGLGPILLSLPVRKEMRHCHIYIYIWMQRERERWLWKRQHQNRPIGIAGIVATNRPDH